MCLLSCYKNVLFSEFPVFISTNYALYRFTMARTLPAAQTSASSAREILPVRSVPLLIPLLWFSTRTHIYKLLVSKLFGPSMGEPSLIKFAFLKRTTLGDP